MSSFHDIFFCVGVLFKNPSERVDFRIQFTGVALLGYTKKTCNWIYSVNAPYESITKLNVTVSAEYDNLGCESELLKFW